MLCSGSSPWYFWEASGLVLEQPEAEPAGTARHRTRQPGEISRPSSRQKHGRIPIIPGPLTRKYMEASLQAFFQFIIFQAKRKDPFQGSVRPSSKTWNDLLLYVTVPIIPGFLSGITTERSLTVPIIPGLLPGKKKGVSLRPSPKQKTMDPFQRLSSRHNHSPTT